MNKKEKCYQFDFEGTIRGYGIVFAKDEKEAAEKILNDNYDDIMDTYGMEIKKVTSLEVEND